MTALFARTGVDDAEYLRAQVYTLLGRLLLAPPDAALLNALGTVPRDASPLGSALGALADVASQTPPARAEREFHDLFIGVTQGEVVPYASYYRTGFLNDKPLAALRADMAPLGLCRAPGVPEPEDHLGALCEMMATLIARGTDLPTQKTFFDRHIAPWAGVSFADIERAPSALLYRPVGTIGGLLLSIEDDAFALLGG
ncbi:MAG: molecular chaperone TorD family protein [Rhodospirillaceae bacterium]